MSDSGIYVHVDVLDNFSKDLFDKREVRKGMREAGALVRTAARNLVDTASRFSEYPHKATGTLRDSIRAKVSRPGFMVVIRPELTAKMRAKSGEFYPAFLHYGVKNSSLKGAERRRARRRGKLSGSWRIAPRANYMEDALQDRKQRVKAVLVQALRDALR